MTVTHKICVDLIRPEEHKVYMMQGDAHTRTVQIVLKADGADYRPPSGTGAVVRYRKEDGTGGVYSTLPDGSAACAVSDNTVTVKLIPQMLSTSGFVTASIALTNSGSVLGLFSFRIHVESDPSLGTAESENYFSFETLEEINAALAGYSSAIDTMGTNIHSIHSVASDSEAETMLIGQIGDMAGQTFRRIVMSMTTVSPSLESGGHWYVDIYKLSTNYAMITARSYIGGGRILQRVWYSGVLEPWEWVNPPMTLGKEYRTIERYDGHVVYKKAVSFGTLPNNSEKSAALLDKNLNVIDFSGFAKGTSYNISIPGYSGIKSLGYTPGTGNLWVSTNMDMSSYNARLIVKYYK